MFNATRTKPYLSVAASILALHLHSPSKFNMINAKRALCYWLGTSNIEMNLRLGKNTELSAYVDTIWGNESERNCRSISGLMILYFEAVFIATSTLQRCVSLSSAEVEFVALSEATEMILWLRNLLKELYVQ